MEFPTRYFGCFWALSILVFCLTCILAKSIFTSYRKGKCMSVSNIIQNVCSYIQWSTILLTKKKCTTLIQYIKWCILIYIQIYNIMFLYLKPFDIRFGWWMDNANDFSLISLLGMNECLLLFNFGLICKEMFNHVYCGIST